MYGGLAISAMLLAAASLAGAAALLVRHRRLRADLFRAEARNRATFSQRGVGIARIGPDGRFLEVNPYLCHMIGYSEQELLGRRIRDLTHPDDRSASDEARERLVASPAGIEPHVVERRYVRKDGETVWALLSVAAARDRSGAAESLIGIVLDVTDLRRAQQELDWKTALLRTQQEASLDAILLVDGSGRIVSFNERFLALWGVSRDAVDAGDDEPVLRAVVAQVREPEAFLAKVRRLYEQRDAPSHDELETLDGRTIDRYSAPVIGPNGAYIGRIWFFRDITDRKRSESRLRESEERFRRMADTIGEAFWMSPPEAASAVLYVSPAFESIWGRPSADLLASPSLWLEAAHPDDAPRLRAARERLAQGTPYDIEFRIRRPDGTQRWVNDRGYPLRDDSGAVILTCGVASDISRRKEADESVRLSALAFDSIADGVMVTDASARILSVNHAFTAITGYSQEEIVGQNPRFLQSGRHDAAFYRQMWGALQTSGHWRGEVWDRRKSGEVYPELLSISAVRDAAGAVTHYVGVSTEISSLKNYEARLHHQAHHDALTGLPNRLLFRERFPQTLARARRHGKTAAVMILDLDNFKHVNDSLGHAAGDRLLQQVADRLRPRIRETDTLARFGGDEFALLLDMVRDQQAVGVVARTLVDALAAPYSVAGHEISVTASIGVSCYPQDGNDPETLFKNADTAMYRAKSEGRNTYQFFAEEMNAHALELLTLGSGLRAALQRDELCLHYQPQYDLARGVLTGVEALVRWRHPQLGLIPPGRFIPVAEETGLIELVGEWVLGTACRQMKEWVSEGLALPRIAVNLSARQFRNPHLLQNISAALSAADLPAHSLELEITESMVLQNPSEAASVLSRLKAMGTRIAVDDFGTGYSSFGSLKRLPIDVLKIDRSFVDGVPADHDDAAIVRAIIAMARSLRLHLIAEGVETEAQRVFLEREGCQEGQGYLFSRPVEAAEMRRLLVSTTA